MSAARKGALACVVAAAANGAIVPECKNALDERLSGLGQIVDGDTVIDCQTLSSRGLCRFAGHLCDAACDRCGVPAHVRGGLTFVREDGAEEPLELLWYVDETIAAAAARLCVLIDSWGIRDAAPGFAALFDQPWGTAERRELAARQPASWDDLRARSDLGLPVRLNVGGHEDCHPKANFWEFACVGFDELRQLEGKADQPDGGPAYAAPWHVEHDLTTPLGLPAAKVDEILCEHVLEHLPSDAWPTLLADFHRVLRPGGVLRLAVPDYGAPGEPAGADPAQPEHLVLPTAASLRAALDASPFRGAYHLRQFWENGTFVDEAVRPHFRAATGVVKRCPQRAAYFVLNGVGARYARRDAATGAPLASSLVVDMYKAY